MLLLLVLLLLVLLMVLCDRVGSVATIGGVAMIVALASADHK